MEFNHISVLLNECIDNLNIKKNGIYFDGTAGGGGHSLEILKKLDKGRLISVDQDYDAIKYITKKLQNYNNVDIIHDNFCNILDILKSLNIQGVDGVLLDLGVSSYQLDTPERGFSYRHNGKLDMRMSKNGVSARQIVNNFVVEDLAKILYDFGEEKFSYSIAKNIQKYRNRKPIETTFELVDIIKNSVPDKYKRSKHPAKKTFQALRIAVNDEIGNLKKAINDSFQALNVNGVLAVITFHSIEDRIVKNFFKQCCTPCICPPDFPLCVCDNKKLGELVNRKPILPSKEELDFNNRSRSAKLRVIKKI